MRKEYFWIPLAVSIVDLAIFGFIYSIHSMFFKEFPLNDALKVGGTAVLIRIIYGQFILQTISLCLIYYFNKSLKFLPTVVISSLSLIASFAIILGKVNVLLIFKPIHLNNIGAGFAIIISITVAWLAYKYLYKRNTPNKSSKSPAAGQQAGTAQSAAP